MEMSPSHKKNLVRLLALLLTFTVINGTMFNVTIPDIAESFNLMPSQVSWVMTGYILVYAIGSVMYGKLADVIPLKRLLTIGIILFSFGSILGFLSPNYTTLLFARILQALGGAAIPALGFIIPSRYFTHDRGKVFGIISSTVAFASGVGPIAGGLIGGFLDWRFLFLVPASAALAIPLFRRWLPDEEVRSQKIDYFGAVLVAIFVASLLLFVTMLIWSLLLISIIAFALLVFHINRVDSPFIDPVLLKNRRYTITIFTSFLGTSVMFGLIFVLPIMMRDLYDATTLGIGLLLFPGAMAAGIFGRFGGTLIDKKGSIYVLRIALLLVAIGVFFISVFTSSSLLLLGSAVFIAYIGFPLLQSATANLLSHMLTKEETGVGMGLFNLCNFISGAFSSAIFGSILDLEGMTFSINPLNAHGDHAIYSNLYLVLSVVAVFALFMFFAFYNRSKKA